MSSREYACEECRAARAKCDHGKPKCSRCQKRGLECHTRKRKKYKENRKKRGAAAASPRPKKKTKTNTASDSNAIAAAATSKEADMLKLVSTTTETFHSPEVDLTAFKMFSKLPPSHFALQTMLKIFLVMACRKASMPLLHLSTSFATAVGLTNIFPSLGNLKRVREVKRGDFSDIPVHVLRKHDAALCATANDAGSAAGAAAKNWGSDRILLVASKEFAPGGAVFAASDEAWRLLNLDETELRTAFQAHDDVIKAAFDTADYNKIAHAVLSMLVTFETRHSPTKTVCTENVTFHSPAEGPILGHMYSTLSLGTNGLDGANIQEFVPMSKISSGASAMVIEGNEEDFTAAEAIMALGHK